MAHRSPGEPAESGGDPASCRCCRNRRGVGERRLAGPPSKARKILRRTSVGSLLVLALSSALWFTSHSSDGRPIFYATAVVLIAAAVEVSRLGSLASHNLLLVLLAAVLGVLFLEDCAIREFNPTEIYERELEPFFPGSARRGWYRRARVTWIWCSSAPAR